MRKIIPDNLSCIAFKSASDFFGFFFGLFFVYYVSLAVSSKIFGGETFGVIASSFVLQAALSVWLVLYAKHRKLSFKFTLQPKSLFAKAIKYTLLALLLVFATMALWKGVLFLLGVKYEMQNSIDLWLSASGVAENAMAFLSIAVLAPISEELLFRGYLYRILKGAFKPLFSAMVVSLLFAGIHFSVEAFVSLAALSFLFCAVYEKYRDIRLNILVHSLFNIVNILMIGLCGLQQ